MKTNEYRLCNIVNSPYGECEIYGVSKDCIQIKLPDNESIFDFDDDQAELIGQALVRWAQRSRAETEMIRCNQKVPHAS